VGSLLPRLLRRQHKRQQQLLLSGPVGELLQPQQQQQIPLPASWQEGSPDSLGSPVLQEKIEVFLKKDIFLLFFRSCDVMIFVPSPFLKIV